MLLNLQRVWSRTDRHVLRVGEAWGARRGRAPHSTVVVPGPPRSVESTRCRPMYVWPRSHDASANSSWLVAVTSRVPVSYPHARPEQCVARQLEYTIRQVRSGEWRPMKHTANINDILAFFHERLLAAESLAREVLAQPPRLGYLTISNALQRRLQYRRAITEAGHVEGIDAL